MHRIIPTLLICLLVCTPRLLHAQTPSPSPSDFVRTASIYLWGGPLLDQNMERLSHFDLLVLPVETQVYNKSFFSNIRTLNPDIIILAYVATVSWNDLYWTDPLHKSMYPNIQASWWLKDGSGAQKSVWPNTRALNLNTPWIDYLAQHVKNDVLSTGVWDGIFYDEVQDSISWVGSVDVNKDGVNDAAKEADTLWATRYAELFQKTREQIGPDTILITNGSSNSAFSPYVNGRMFETFPSAHSSVAEWLQMMKQYLTLQSTVGFPAINFINVNTDNSNGNGSQSDYRTVRFGLTSTLLGNGYFGYDESTYNHAVIWEYDEYEAFLGTAKSGPINTFNPQMTSLSAGVWEREFTQGKIVVNATDSPQSITLGGEFEKLHGSQDPLTNNGAIVSSVVIPSKDGIVLLRPLNAIFDATFLNGAFTRVFSAEGEQKRTGFFAYDEAFRGGTQVIRVDLDGDGVREAVVADESRVFIYAANGQLRSMFYPYGEHYDRGINLAVGDLENDGRTEIVTGTEKGGGPHIRVFNHEGTLINPGFFAYAKNFRGGVSVGIGDLNGDGTNEIIAGAGFGGGPHVRVFNKDGKLINPGFFAYDPSFRGGVNVSVADINSDGIDEIVTGPGVGGSPLARVYDRNGKKQAEFYVFDQKQRRGLKVVASDVDGDGRAEILGLTTDVFTLSLF